MKYIVMECHEGYAILMDEDARFVNAANLHYNVGQSVTDPILMEEEQGKSRIKMYVTRFAAAAACIGILATAGSMYYARNLKPYSTILISSDAKIRMEINQKGKVITIKSDDKEIQEILKEYNGKGKDKLTAANEIIELEKEKGIISSGDTISVYVDSQTSKDYDSFKEDIVSGNSDINVKVRGLDAPAAPAKEKDKAKDKVTITKPDPPKETKAPEPPKPEKDKVNTPEPPAPNAVTPPAPAEPPATKVETPKPNEPAPDKKVEPPAPPSDPEPPKAPEKPDDNAKHEIVRPDELKPPAHNEAEPAPPEPKKPLSVVEDAITDIQKSKPLTMEAVHAKALHAAPEPEHEEEAPAPQPEAHAHPQPTP